MDYTALTKKIVSSGLFDADWYLARYPDVGMSKLDPLEHFVRVGALLGRDPGPKFYRHPDLEKKIQSAKDNIAAVLQYLAHNSELQTKDRPQSVEVHSAMSDSSVGIRLGIVSANEQDLTLTISGWAANEGPPRQPLRFRLEIEGDVFSVPEILTLRGVSDNRPLGMPESALFFSFSCELPEHCLGKPVSLRVADSETRFNSIPVDWSGKMPRHHAAFTTPTSQRPTEPKDTIIGSVDEMRPNSVSGWAINRDHPDSDVPELILYADGRPHIRTKCTTFRANVRRTRGGNGIAGFNFALAPNLLASGSVKIKVTTTIGKMDIKEAVGHISLPGLHIESSLPPETNSFKLRSTIARGKKISVIILNRNGSGILRGMLESAQRVGELTEFEWIVVDHQSRDDSAGVCAAAVDNGADIKFLNRKGNFSFSESNNFGAKQARGDILVFANNDLLFRKPVGERLLTALEDDRIGLVGAQLLDHVEAAGWQDRLPVQHLGVFMKPLLEKDYLRPYESRLTKETPLHPETLQARPAVTAAFVAMRRQDFEAIGGFDEGYLYGLEDTDLSFKVRDMLRKEVVCDNGLEIVHHHGFSRNKDSNAVVRRRNNNNHFNRTWAQWIRRNIRREVLSRPGFWTGARPVIGFVVTDTSTSEDFYTALELGRALQQIAPVHLRFVAEADWEELARIDILIVMASTFDLTKVKSINPFAITVNWQRQWFDERAEASTTLAYDHVWVCSQLAADYLCEHTECDIAVLPLASNTKFFSSGQRRAEFACDYCCTGGYDGVAGDTQFLLDPPSIRGKGIVFGKNLEGTPLAPISVDPIGYEKLPDVYASARVVIDDATFPSSFLGSCNNRIFDALAAGCLVVTNGEAAARELFGDLIPIYHDKQSLTDTLNYWLSHENERKERVAQLRGVVEKEHSYLNRARKVVALLKASPARTRIAIKCPAPMSGGKQWGDFHFAQSLATALRKTGAVVRVDLRECWEGSLADTDDVAIVLRGVRPYKPKPHQKNMIWLISHPDEVPLSELNEYDHVYVASSTHAELLAGQCKVPVTFLPQCTDTARFGFDLDMVNTRSDRVLFVGNSRGVFRDSVRWAVEHGLDLHIYGRNWEPFIADERLRGTSIPNSVLGGFYASSRVVLCDHWEDMRRLGYISNRVFDVLAVGGRLAVDNVRGLHDLLPTGSYEVFCDGYELAEIANRSVEVDASRRAEIAAWVAANHSFDARARTLAATLSAWGLLTTESFGDSAACPDPTSRIKENVASPTRRARDKP